MKHIENKFYYDEETGYVLKRVGSNHSRGYLTTEYKGKTCFVHRVVWEIYHGKIPKGMTIDHINHNKKDNRLCNLRLVTNAENKKNLPIYKTNKSGHTGVYWNKEAKKWVAQIRVQGKSVHLGHFYELQDAVEARKDAEIVHNYHPNHGKGV